MRARTKIFLGLGAGIGFGMAGLACGGDNSEIEIVTYGDASTTIVTLADGGTATAGKLLISSSPTAANAQCASGGTTINVGFDTNANGTLDPGEITSSQEICNAATVTTTTDGGAAAQILTDVTASPSDEKCANGGIIVTSGPDTNGNGKLDPGEITSTQEICTGGGTSILSITTAIPVGSAICPLGGTETQSGADNGAGGGVAGDGILESGEITSTVNTCVQSSNAGAYSVQPFAPPGGAAGTSTISLNGGTSTTATGGAAGNFTVTRDGTLGGHLSIFATGAGDASFTLPAYTASFGATVCDITAATTLATNTATAATAGTCFLDSNNNGLLSVEDTGGTTATVATGLHVEAAGTLTISTTAAVTISVVDDIDIEGALIKTAGNLTLNSTSGAFVGGTAGSITTTGAAGTTGAGTAGGAVTITANAIYNQAAITTTGGAGATAATAAAAGGAGGAVTLRAANSASLHTQSPFFNKGAVTTTGGAGTVGGGGGAAGSVSFTSTTGGLFNSGAIVATGGAGSTATAATGVSGTGGAVAFTQTYGGGEFANSGAITTSGGFGPAGFGTQPGGGAITFSHAGGQLVSTGALTTSSNADATGRAGNLTINSANGYDSVTGSTDIAYGDVVLSGNLALNGGNGQAGGTLSITQTAAPSQLTGQQVRFLGYSDVFLDGGDGLTGGGAGGILTLNNKVSNAAPGGRNNTQTGLQGSGAVLNYANVTATGGNVTGTTTGSGGNGGRVLFSTSAVSADVDDAELIVNAGAITLNSGNGYAGGGTSGYLTFTSNQGLTNSGKVTSKGGNGTTTTGGGFAAALTLSTGGVLTNSGVFTTAGGNGATNGGNAAAISFNGVKGLNDTASLSAIGGNGGTATGNTGGAGGNITLQSAGTFADTGATFTATAGTGATAGTAGTITINGVVQH